MCDRAIVLLILGTHAAEHCVAPVTLNISDDSVISSVALTREPPAPAFRFRQRFQPAMHRRHHAFVRGNAVRRMATTCVAIA